MPDYTLFPSILPEEDQPFIDNQYTREELERKDRPALQQLAAAHESEEINGKASSEEIITFLTGEERLESA